MTHGANAPRALHPPLGWRSQAVGEAGLPGPRGLASGALVDQKTLTTQTNGQVTRNLAKGYMMRILQVLPSVLRDVDGELEIDVDFAQVVRVYAANFEAVTVACPVTMQVMDLGLERCIPVEGLGYGPDRVKFVPLPNGYRMADFLRNRELVRNILAEEIAAADYLIFSPHTLVGDWPTTGIREAIRLGKPYVVEADVVYESVSQVRNVAPWKRAITRQVFAPMFSRSYRHSLKHSSLALFQGQDTFDAYAPFCVTAHKCFNVPIYKGDHITEAELQAKLMRLDRAAPIKICYAGRAVPMKGPIEWLNVVGELVKRSVPLEATWMGDGSMLDEMTSYVAANGLTPYVNLAGYVSDHKAALSALKAADVFLFCHKTLELPRVLGEALACGCPLIGYRGAYPADLVSTSGGGQFADLGDWRKLAEIIEELNASREGLKSLIVQASKSGQRHDRDTELQRRVELIKQFGRNRAP